MPTVPLLVLIIVYSFCPSPLGVFGLKTRSHISWCWGFRFIRKRPTLKLVPIIFCRGFKVYKEAPTLKANLLNYENEIV